MPLFSWLPANQHEAKDQIIKVAGLADGLDAVFANCPQLDAGTRAQWQSTFARWKDFAERNTGLFNFAPWEAFDTATRFEQEFKHWQEVARLKCGSVAPSTVLPSDVPPTPGSKTAEHIAIAGAVIVGGVVLLAGGAYVAHAFGALKRIL